MFPTTQFGYTEICRFYASCRSIGSLSSDAPVSVRCGSFTSPIGRSIRLENANATILSRQQMDIKLLSHPWCVAKYCDLRYDYLIIFYPNRVNWSKMYESVYTRLTEVWYLLFHHKSRLSNQSRLDTFDSIDFISPAKGGVLYWVEDPSYKESLIQQWEDTLNLVLTRARN